MYNTYVISRFLHCHWTIGNKMFLTMRETAKRNCIQILHVMPPPQVALIQLLVSKIKCVTFWTFQILTPYIIHKCIRSVLKISIVILNSNKTYKEQHRIQVHFIVNRVIKFPFVKNSVQFSLPFIECIVYWQNHETIVCIECIVRCLSYLQKHNIF